MVDEKEPIDLVFDAKFRQLRDDFSENYFQGKAKTSVGLFALAIGIRMNKYVTNILYNVFSALFKFI